MGLHGGSVPGINIVTGHGFSIEAGNGLVLGVVIGLEPGAWTETYPGTCLLKLDTELV